MDKIIELINTDNPGKYDLIRLKSLNIYPFHKKVLVELLIPKDHYDEVYDKAYEEELYRNVQKHIPKYKLELKVRKSFADPNLIANEIKTYVNENYSVAASEIQSKHVEVTQKDGVFHATLSVSEFVYRLFQKSDFVPKINQYMYRSFTDKCEVGLRQRQEAENDYVSTFEDNTEIYTPKLIEVSDVEGYIGDAIGVYPGYVSNSMKDIQNATLCGKIMNVERRISKSEKLFYTFTVQDPTGIMRCIFFPRGDNGTRFEAIQSETEVLMQGDVKRGNMGDSYTFWLRKLSFCKINWNCVQEDIVYKDEPGRYTTVYPMPYHDEIQEDFLTESKATPEFLKGKTFVVFDTETTGLDTSSCKIIELAACKIVDGEIKETFSTFINPEERISAEITALTTITDDDVKDAPKNPDVMADFYKFTRGADLVAQNASFDIPFIDRFGKAAGYNFNNTVYDTLVLARKYTKGVANHKLGTLCEHYGIDLTGAHRAINDAIATAKLFIILAENL